MPEAPPTAFGQPLHVSGAALYHFAQRQYGNPLMPYQHTSQDLTVGSNALVGRVFPHQLRYLCDVLGRFIYDGWLDQRSQFADSDAALLGLLLASESFKSARFGTSAIGITQSFIPTGRRPMQVSASMDEVGASPHTA